MEIIEYQHDKDRIEEYTDFLRGHYSADFRILTRIEQVKRMLNSNNPFFSYGEIRNFMIKEKNQVAGHCSAILDNRNKDIGLIGFYDCIEDEKASEILLGKCSAWLKTKGCSKIRGPINLTIWHDYRFISKCKRNPGIFDPFSKDYYAQYWENMGFKNAGKYVSAVRQDFNYVIPHTKKDYDGLLKLEFKLRIFNKKDTNDLRILLDLANKIFAESWNFIPLSYEEFYYLYENILNSADLSYVEIAEDNNSNPIGFCFSLPNPHNKEQMVLKTMGVLPEFRRQNIAGALLYSQHTRAKNEGFKEFYYPLIRVGNNVTKFFPYGGYDIIIEYEVFELS